MKIGIITVWLLFLSVTGGLMVFTTPSVTIIWLLVTLLAVFYAVWLMVAYPEVRNKGLWAVIVWPGVAVVVSYLTNLDIYEHTNIKVGLYVLAVAVMIISSQVEADTLLDSMLWAGLLYPIIYLIVGDYNPNIAASWCILFVVPGLARLWGVWRVAYLLVYAVLLLYISSRGAIIGTVVAAAVWMGWYRSKWFWLAGLSFVIFLYTLSPKTAGYRFHYWQSAFDAFLSYPLVGAGPGGIKARQLITEPGSSGWQIHAHNILLSWLAETGIIGVLSILYAVRQFYRSHIVLSHWQIATLSGILAHSMVDEPLWWPGLLLAVAMLVGVRKF